MRRLETVRTQEEDWQEPCESGGSRTDLWERGGEIPLRYPTLKYYYQINFDFLRTLNFCDTIYISQV